MNMATTPESGIAAPQVFRYDVVIVGAGWSGIFALKHCLEKGLTAIVLEASDNPGGQWVFRPNTPGGVLPSTTSVSSKLYMSPSDFPLPDHMPEFPSSGEIYQHFCNYMDHFRLHAHIKLNTRVASVEKQDGLWVVKSTYNKESNIYHGKNIVIATGANLTPKYPSEPMYANFTGTTSHVADFKDDTSFFADKRVLFIGASDSGCDLAHKIRDLARTTTVSLRKGAWFQSRDAGEQVQTLKGVPADMFNNRFAQNIIGLENCTDFFENYISSKWGSCGSGIPEWQNKQRYEDTYYVKSRDLVFDVRAGKVQPRRGVRDIKGNQVWFHGRDEPEEFDHIVFATGYGQQVNFKTSFSQQNDRYNLVLDVEDPSVAWLGYCRPFLTSFVMIIEMQALYVASCFSGETLLPDPAVQKQAIAKEMAYLSRRFPEWNYNKLIYLIDPYRYMDILASEMEMRPNLITLFFSNPNYWLKSVFCAWSQYHYFINDKNPTKRAIANEEMEKLFEHPMSRQVRGDVLFFLFWRPLLVFLSLLFGLRSKVTRSYIKLSKAVLRGRCTTNLSCTPEIARLCLVSHVALADGVLSTEKMVLLDNLRADLGIAHELEDIMEFSRVTKTDKLLGQLDEAQKKKALSDIATFFKREMSNGSVLSEQEITKVSSITSLLACQVQFPSVQGIQCRYGKIQVHHTINKPDVLVLFFGWFGANPKHVQKYIQAYDNASSIVAVASRLDIVTCNTANLIGVASCVVELAAQEIKKNPGIPVVVHSFSTGGAALVEHLDRILCMESSSNKSAQLVKGNLNLQIFDSGPVPARIGNMVRGAWAASPLLMPIIVTVSWLGPRIGNLKGLVSGRPSALHSFWTHMKEAKVEHVPVRAYIYSTEDAICNVGDLRDIIDSRRQMSETVFALEFPTGSHCNLLRRHTKEYCGFVRTLLLLTTGGRATDESKSRGI